VYTRYHFSPAACIKSVFIIVQVRSPSFIVGFIKHTAYKYEKPKLPRLRRPSFHVQPNLIIICFTYNYNNIIISVRVYIYFFNDTFSCLRCGGLSRFISDLDGVKIKIYIYIYLKYNIKEKVPT